jgi:hypothetical protein
MIKKINELTIKKLKTHTVFLPLTDKELFIHCRQLLLNFTGNSGFLYTNSQSVCNDVLKGTSFVFNTNQMITTAIHYMDNIQHESEDMLIKDLCEVCQKMANLIKKPIYYQANTLNDEVQSFQIIPEIN